MYCIIRTHYDHDGLRFPEIKTYPMKLEEAQYNLRYFAIRELTSLSLQLYEGEVTLNYAGFCVSPNQAYREKAEQIYDQAVANPTKIYFAHRIRVQVRVIKNTVFSVELYTPDDRTITYFMTEVPDKPKPNCVIL